MIANSTSTSAADLAATSLEEKPAQPQGRSMSRHGTAASLPASFPCGLAEDLDHDSDIDVAASFTSGKPAEAMSPNSTSTSAADLAATSLEEKLAQPQSRSTSRHDTAASLPASSPGGLAEHSDHNSDIDFEGAADWDLDDIFHEEEEFQDRPRFKYQIDEDMAFRPDLYADAYEVADGDLLLYDWESDELPEEDAAAFEIDELQAEAKYQVQPAGDMASFNVSEKSTPEDGSPLLVPKVPSDVLPVDASENSTPEDVPVRQTPKAPPSTAPRGFARKHQDVLVVGSSVQETSETSPPKHSGQEASETSPPKHEAAKMPQGSALAAIAALRPAAEGSRSSGSAEPVQPLVPAAPAEKPLKKRPCNSVAVRLAGGAATAPVTSTFG